MDNASVLPPNARGLLAAGLYGSASTWMFNLIARILKIGGRSDVRTIYMDDVSEAAAEVIRNAPFVLAKSHIPSPALRILAEQSRTPVILTVRDPRDSVASMMLRWHVPFELALRRVRASARAIAGLANYRRALLFRYEDGFMLDERSADAVAAWLGVALSPGDRATLLGELTPQAVKARIAGWQQSGVLGKGPPDLEYEPETHWHVGHVGDGATGKWPATLGAARAAQVAYATSAFREAYDYRMGEPLSSGARLSFAATGVGANYLGEGFANSEPWGIWTKGEAAALNLPLVSPIGKSLRLELELVRRSRLFGPQLSSLPRVTLNGEPAGEVRPGRRIGGRCRLVLDRSDARLADVNTLRIGFELGNNRLRGDLGIPTNQQPDRLGLVGLRLDYK